MRVALALLGRVVHRRALEVILVVGLRLAVAVAAAAAALAGLAVLARPRATRPRAARRGSPRR